MSLENRPDAILTAIDMIGVGCVKEFRAFGVDIPVDMSVIGFDNVFLSELIDPPLTTIGQPIREMGQAAAEILISVLEGKPCQNTVVFEGKLVVRATT
jgi:LacI family transcriptional regulator